MKIERDILRFRMSRPNSIVGIIVACAASVAAWWLFSWWISLVLSLLFSAPLIAGLNELFRKKSAIEISENSIRLESNGSSIVHEQGISDCELVVHYPSIGQISWSAGLVIRTNNQPAISIDSNAWGVNSIREIAIELKKRNFKAVERVYFGGIEIHDSGEFFWKVVRKNLQFIRILLLLLFAILALVITLDFIRPGQPMLLFASPLALFILMVFRCHLFSNLHCPTCSYRYKFADLLRLIFKKSLSQEKNLAESCKHHNT